MCFIKRETIVSCQQCSLATSNHSQSFDPNSKHTHHQKLSLHPMVRTMVKLVQMSCYLNHVCVPHSVYQLTYTLTVPLTLISFQPDPYLKRQNANMPPSRRKISFTLPSPPRIIHQFASHPYLNSNRILINGYIHQLAHDSSLRSIYSVSFMKDLCATYYYADEDGYDQLAYHIYSVLKKLNKTGLSLKLLMVITKKYLRLKKREGCKEILRLHCSELIRLGYIRRLNDVDCVYVFSNAKIILFDQ